MLIAIYSPVFLDGIKLKFDAEALDWVVDKAVELKLGAGLRGILESLQLRQCSIYRVLR